MLLSPKGFRHLGTVELAVRYSQVQIDHDAFPLFASPKSAAQQAQERGIGLNWYLNQFVKLTTDFQHTNFRMALRTVTPLHSENVLMSRIQLAFCSSPSIPLRRNPRKTERGFSALKQSHKPLSASNLGRNLRPRFIAGPY
jgi:hypothetical protein